MPCSNENLQSTKHEFVLSDGALNSPRPQNPSTIEENYEGQCRNSFIILEENLQKYHENPAVEEETSVVEFDII